VTDVCDSEQSRTLLLPPDDSVPDRASDQEHNMQIVTGIEVNSEAYFPKLREYWPSAEGTCAIFPQLREIRLTIDILHAAQQQ